MSLGVRYILVDDSIKSKYNLPTNYGAFIIYGSTQPSILENSLAKQYGIQEGDIILSLDNYRVDAKHPIDEFLKDVCIGDSIKVKILRDRKEIIIKIIFN
ncbi:MAG: PDZ domain-containing protein [Candidatus Pacebacteria bacterium]|nr:PDZ domain-containing protein [Candidatus Paceibacterota bacterium]MDD3808035.1 PDZ domain-containing protein [Candidatus Paceibacterota bacterium]